MTQNDPADSVRKDTPNLTYKLDSNGIHIFMPKNQRRAVIDDLMGVFDELYKTTPSDQTLLRLFDLQTSLPSVSYTVQKSRELLKKHPKPPKSRNAIIYKDSVALSLLGTSIRFLPLQMPLAFFRPEERDRAIAWLLQS